MNGGRYFPQRQVEFICLVCGRPGKGVPHSKVHPGQCRRKWQASLNLKYERKSSAGRTGEMP